MVAPLSSQQLLRIGLLGLAFLLGLISIFAPWWVIQTSVNEFSSSEDMRPYDPGQFNSGNADLTMEAVLTGIFATLAVLGVAGFLLLEALPALGRTALPVHRLGAVGVAVAFGLVAILYTTFAWPAEASDELSFFDSQTAAAGGFSATIEAAAGWGWYTAILATIVLPAVAFFLALRDAAGMAPAPEATRLAQPTYAPAAPPAAPAAKVSRKK